MKKMVSGLAWFQFLAFLVLAALAPAFFAPAVVFASQTEQVEVVIPVTYTADNVNVNLRCRLEYEENENQIITNDTLYLKDGEEGSFTITYTAAGTYYCQLRQIKGSVDNVYYDERIIYLAVYVTADTAGKLYADAVLYEDGSDKLPSAYFVNREETPVTPTPEASATPTKTPSATPKPGVTPTKSPSATPKPSAAPTESPSATPTPEASVTPSESPAITPTAEPEPSEATDRTEETNPVKTADDTPSAEPYAVMLLLAAFAVPAVLVYRKRRM